MEWNFDDVPVELKERKQWTVWRSEWRNGKENKVPYSPHGGYFSVSDSTTWGSFDQAVEVYTRDKFSGIGYVFSNDDGYAGLDIDDCIDPETVTFTDSRAEEMVRRLNSYTEVSPSGTGVKIWVKANKRRKDNRFNCVGFECEFYDRGRYFAVTGMHLPDTPGTIEDRDEEYNAILDELAEEKAGWTRQNRSAASPSSLSMTNCSDSTGQPRFTDEDLLLTARRAANGGAFEHLFNGLVKQSKTFDHSRADLKLCLALCFWAGDNSEEQVDRIFRTSQLIRSKWDEVHDGDGRTYGEMTIANAYEMQRKRGFYSPNMFGYTPLGMTERLIQSRGDDIRYCAEQKTWYLWDGTRWDRCVDSHKLIEIAKATVRNLYRLLDTFEDEKDKRALRKFIHSSETRYMLESMVSLARSNPAILISESELEGKPWLLNFTNGTLDLQTGKLRSHGREDLLTERLSFPYDSTVECPAWTGFLEWAVPVEETRNFIQRAVGCTLTGMVREQLLLFLYGNGRNGKSTFTGVLEKLISPYWIKSRADLLMATRRGEPRQGPTPELVRMRGKRLVTVSEVQQDHRLHEALIKDLTGGDAITGRNLYENEITFQPSHKIWMYGNHKPEIKGTDLGIRRRVKLIPFDQQLAAEDVDTSLPEKLEAELPGIMAWAVQGCLKWQKSGLGDPAEIRQATDDYFAENDTVCRFIDECCKAALPGFGDFTSVVFEKYKLWCKDETEDPIKQKSFSIDLKRRGYEITRHSSGKSMFSALEIIK